MLVGKRNELRLDESVTAPSEEDRPVAARPHQGGLSGRTEQNRSKRNGEPPTHGLTVVLQRPVAEPAGESGSSRPQAVHFQ